MAKCSEMAKIISNVFHQYSKLEEVKTVDDIVKMMISDEPSLTRADILEAVNAVDREQREERRAKRKTIQKDALAEAGANEKESARLTELLGREDGDLSDAEVAELETLNAKVQKLAKGKRKASAAKAEMDRLDDDEAKLEAVKKGEKIPTDAAVEDLGRYAQRLARRFVKEGIRDRDALIDAVHAELMDADPGITRDETMDAISGYGKYFELSQKEEDVALRDLKAQMQKVAQERDLHAAGKTKPTGMQRDKPSDEVRHLQAKVNEAKRKVGVALESIKRRYRHAIADLNEQIAKRERIVKTKTPIDLDPEAVALRAQVKELQQQLKDILGDREMTDEQRLKVAIAATEKSIAELERRISENDLSPAKKEGKPLPESPELDALKEKQAKLRVELAAMRKAAAAPARLAAAMTREEARIIEIEDKIQRGDFKAGEKNGPEINAALDAIRKRRRALESEYNANVTREKLQAIVDWIKAGNKYERPSPKQRVLTERHEKVDFEIRKLRSQIDLHVESQKPQSAWGKYFRAPTRLLGSLITTGEFSPVLIQGSFFALGHPVKVYGAVKRAFTHMSERGEDRAMRDLEKRPNWWLYQKARVHFTEANEKLSRREESMLSEWIDKIPGIAATARFYRVFLNTIRADMMDGMLQTSGTSLDKAQLRALGFMVNAATGRGSFGKYESVAQLAAEGLFAPRHYMSRIQILSTAPIWYAPKGAVRNAVVKEYCRYLAGMATVLSLGALMASFSGDDEDMPEIDPRSSDFLKVKSGSRRFDYMGGIQQFAVAGARLGFALTNGLFGTDIKEYKRSDGLLVRISGPDVPYGGRTTGDVATDLLRGKMSPGGGIVADLSTGKDFMGTPISDPVESPFWEGTKDFGPAMNRAARFVGRFSGPIAYRQIIEIMKSEHGIPANVTASMLQMFGVNVNDKQDRGVSNEASRLAGEQRLLSTKRSNLRKEKKTLSPEDERRYKRLSYFMSGGPDGKGYTELSALIKANKAKGDLAAAKRYGERIDAMAAKFVSQEEAQ